MNTEYLKKAHDADVAHNGHPKGKRDGPMEAALAGRGEVKGYVFGSYGEVSRTVRDLARRCAGEIGHHRVATGQLQVPADADPADYVLPEIRRAWGMANVKRRAQCLLYLLDLTCPGASGVPLHNRSQRQDDLMQRANLLHSVGKQRSSGFDARSFARRVPLMPPLPLTPANNNGAPPAADRG